MRTLPKNTRSPRNVIFQGPPGVGKTHLAIALGLACSEAGHRLRFLTALDLVRRMKLAFAQNRMPHYMKMLTTHKLAQTPHRRRGGLFRPRYPAGLAAFPGDLRPL